MLFDVLTMMEGAVSVRSCAALQGFGHIVSACVPECARVSVGSPCCARVCVGACAHWQVEEEGELLLFDVLIMHTRDREALRDGLLGHWLYLQSGAHLGPIV